MEPGNCCCHACRLGTGHRAGYRYQTCRGGGLSEEIPIRYGGTPGEPTEALQSICGTATLVVGIELRTVLTGREAFSNGLCLQTFMETGSGYASPRRVDIRRCQVYISRFFKVLRSMQTLHIRCCSEDRSILCRLKAFPPSEP